MKTTKFLAPLAAVLIALAFVSCNRTENEGIEALPFQETEDGQWGMISLDGNVLFKDEFKEKPTIVRDGRFFVRNKDGLWEMYDAQEKPKKIGSDFAHISMFMNGRAVVAVKDKPVSIIDTNGETIKLLDKIDGKMVKGVSPLQNDDHAIYMTSDSLCGIIDADGNSTAKADYCIVSYCGEGKYMAIERKYKKDFEKGNKKKIKVDVIDAKGNLFFSFNADKYENFGHQFSDGKLAVSVKKDGKEIFGLINDKGEYVLKPMTKVEGIGNIIGDKFTYYNGEGWGLMDINGQTIIRAKYDVLFYDKENLLLAGTKDGDDVKYKFIDEKDNQIGKDTYVNAELFSAFDGKHTVVKPDDKMFSIIDLDGNQLKGLPDMVNVSFNTGDSFVETDYVDLQKVIDSFQITANGALGLTFNSSAQQVAKAGDPTASPNWYDYRTDVTIFNDHAGVDGMLTVGFNSYLSRETYRTKRVIDYQFYDEYWYHDEKIPTGYVWNAITPSTFTITISHSGCMHGKLRNMLKTLVKKFSSFGKVVKQNDGAAVLELNNGKTALICMSDTDVKVVWGSLGKANAINIDKYKDVQEDMSSGYSGGLDPDDYTADSVATDYDDDSVAAVDSTAADSDAVY